MVVAAKAEGKEVEAEVVEEVLGPDCLLLSAIRVPSTRM